MSTLAQHDNEHWLAFLNRDPAYDGAFVVGVTSTGIYCRPTCSARRPRRENARFFASPADAEAAGFRACKRCRPSVERDAAAAELARKARELIDVEGVTRLDALGERLHVSPFHLQRVFKRVMGASPKQYAMSRRVSQAKDALKVAPTVTHAAMDAGFSAGGKLSEAMDARAGAAPSVYRRRGEGLRIEHVVVPCTLGFMLIAASERGLCAVRFGESEPALVRELRDEFPLAGHARAGAGDVARWAGEVARYVDGLGSVDALLALPLDARGSLFQARVWEALRAIPFGQTRTYAQIAQTIGSPGAARAVAQACGANPVAVVVPCHRVIASDGGLGGYHWGIDRKRALLKREGAAEWQARSG